MAQKGLTTSAVRSSRLDFDQSVSNQKLRWETPTSDELKLSPVGRQFAETRVADRSFGTCEICGREVPYPCIPSDDAPFLRTNPTVESNKSEECDGDRIVVKATVVVLQRAFFCELGCWLAGKNLRTSEIRDMIAYVLYGGLEKGMRYERIDGSEYVLEPETIDEVFDRKKTKHLPVTADWNDEPESSYDRAIRDWLERAVEGEIRVRPDKRWVERLILIALARDVLDSRIFQED